MKTGTQFSMCIISNFIQDEVVTDADGRLLLLIFLTLLAWSGLLRAAEISGVSSRRRGRTHVSYISTHVVAFAKRRRWNSVL